MENAPSMAETGTQLLVFLSDGIITGLPQLADSAVSLMSNFGQYLQENLPSLMQTGLEIVVQLTGSIRENAGKLIDGGIELLKNLAKGFADSIPALIENIPTIVSNIAGGCLKTGRNWKKSEIPCSMAGKGLKRGIMGSFS